jgi:hypothetical protein
LRQENEAERNESKDTNSDLRDQAGLETGAPNMDCGANSDLTRHCPTLTTRCMKTFIVALVLAVFAGVVNAETKG